MADSKVLKLKYENIIWFVYFCVMFNFYTYTYLQLAAQCMIIIYTVYSLCRRGWKLKTFDLQRLWYYLSWYGLFTLWSCLSLKWSVFGANTHENTLLTIVRIFVIGFCLVYYLQTKEELFNIIRILINNGVIFAILTLLINPIGNWGKEIFRSFGNGFMRNGIANFSLLLICFTFFIRKQIPKKRLYILIGLFLCMIVLSGSRRAIIQLGFALFLYVLTEKRVKKQFKIIAAAFLTGSILLLIAYNVDFLRVTYINRILAMLTGLNSTDGSTVGRNAYIVIGWRMFKARQWTGWGLDGFYNYLLRNPYAYSRNFYLEALYSHNNYIEILSSLGMVGFILFYTMHFRVLLHNWKKIRTDNCSRFLFILVAMYFLGDWGGIVFSTHISMYILSVMMTMDLINRKEKFADEVAGNE